MLVWFRRSNLRFYRKHLGLYEVFHLRRFYFIALTTLGLQSGTFFHKFRLRSCIIKQTTAKSMPSERRVYYSIHCPYSGVYPVYTIEQTSS